MVREDNMLARMSTAGFAKNKKRNIKSAIKTANRGEKNTTKELTTGFMHTKNQNAQTSSKKEKKTFKNSRSSTVKKHMDKQQQKYQRTNISLKN